MQFVWIKLLEITKIVQENKETEQLQRFCTKSTSEEWVIKNTINYNIFLKEAYVKHSHLTNLEIGCYKLENVI